MIKLMQNINFNPYETVPSSSANQQPAGLNVKADSHIRDSGLAIHYDILITTIGCMQPIIAR